MKHARPMPFFSCMAVDQNQTLVELITWKVELHGIEAPSFDPSPQSSAKPSSTSAIQLPQTETERVASFHRSSVTTRATLSSRACRCDPPHPRDRTDGGTESGLVILPVPWMVWECKHTRMSHGVIGYPGSTDPGTFSTDT